MQNDNPQPRNAASDGGPAFPRPLSTDDHRMPCNIELAQDGMSQRAYIATALMPTVMLQGYAEATAGRAHYRASVCAELAVAGADALLAELAKEERNG